MYIAQRRSLNLSIMLHVSMFLIAFVGLPVILPEKPDPTPLVMTVEILPITGVTNVKPSDKPIEKEEQQAPTPKTLKPVEPSVKEPPKPAPAPEKPEEKKFDPKEEAEPLKKDEVKPPEPKKEEKPNKAEDFEALLNKLKQENTPTPAKDAKDKKTAEANTTKSDAPYDASLPLSLSERDAIRGQFIPCWRAPAGSKDAESLAVRVKVELLEDGTVKTATLASDQQSRYSGDPFFRAAADSAIRAVHKCSPLKNLPPDKYGTWGKMEINFDPKDML